MKDIEKLRKEVREVDREIIKLIWKRLSITKKIGGKKKNKGIPLKDWKVEKEVIKNAVDVASKEGLSVELIKTIVRDIITESKRQQEILHYSSYSGDKEDILIIGGLGEMGLWFANFFANQGHNVFIHDIKGKSKDFIPLSKNLTCYKLTHYVPINQINNTYPLEFMQQIGLKNTPPEKSMYRTLGRI